MHMPLPHGNTVRTEQSDPHRADSTTVSHVYSFQTLNAMEKVVWYRGDILMVTIA